MSLHTAGSRGGSSFGSDIERPMLDQTSSKLPALKMSLYFSLYLVSYLCSQWRLKPGLMSWLRGKV